MANPAKNFASGKTANNSSLPSVATISRRIVELDLRGKDQGRDALQTKGFILQRTLPPPRGTKHWSYYRRGKKSFGNEWKIAEKKANPMIC